MLKGESESQINDQPLPLYDLCVEVCLKDSSTARYDAIATVVEISLCARYAYLTTETKLDDEVIASDGFLAANVKRIQIGESRPLKRVLDLSQTTLRVFVYQFHDEDDIEAVDISETQVTASRHWALPSRSFEGLWESLVFDNHLNVALLDYIHTALLFGDLGVDPHIINVNRLILLHGPPGTGKTSLCKALAQKLAIRLSDRYSYGKLIEINSHSLFSKFFSESGKLVQKMFEQIQEMIADEDSFVCVLMGNLGCPDEVESLTAARKTAMSGLEPSDALRVVNALLTQLDKLRYKKNVLVLATSNLLDAIDPAFMDRADWKQYIGHPSQRGCYEILRGCLEELIRRGIVLYTIEGGDGEVKDGGLLSWREAELYSTPSPSTDLFLIAKDCLGLSGRMLRKLPFLAHARYIRNRQSDINTFLDALRRTCRDEKDMLSETVHNKDTSILALPQDLSESLQLL